MTLVLHLERAAWAAQVTSATAPAPNRRVAGRLLRGLAWTGSNGEQAATYRCEEQPSPGLSCPIPTFRRSLLDPKADHP